MKNYLKNICFIFLLTFSLLQLRPSFSFAEDAKEYKAQGIKVIENSAKMHYHDKGIVFDSSGTVGSTGIPHVIKIGDVITVKDKTVQANHIFVTEYLKTMKWNGDIAFRKGQVSCVIVSDEQNLPYGEITRDRLWIHVTECQVMDLEEEKQKHPSIVNNYR